MQVRAGTGGEEAALWAADLVRMYSKYADAQGWRTAHIAESQAESGGVKEAILQARMRAWVPSYVMPFAGRIQQHWGGVPALVIVPGPHGLLLCVQPWRESSC